MRLETLCALLGQVMDRLAECSGMSEDELVALGAPRDDATTLLTLNHVYFGDTAFSGKQRAAVAAARERGHGLTTLQLIETFAAKVRHQREAWDLRVELCGTSAELVEKVARKRLREKKKPREYVERATLTEHGNGLATIQVTADSLRLGSVFRRIDPARPGESFFEALGGEVTTPQITTMAVLTLEDYASLVERAEGADGVGPDEDIIVRCTNGATMTGAQLVERTSLELGFVAIVSREHGSLDFYRTRRVASPKQRIMLAAEFTCCAWKDCTVPLEKCQIHHIIPWARGGPTNIANLVPLCPYHNGVNDDSTTNPPRRGRMIRVGGRAAWQPPYPASPVFTSPFN
ncbi:HNH endonuclease signature motif containing protein [Corynebacterium sp.]|uniref:HNH endonuclease signature motif containing protein n=1 Tax=Corynebacterium sp. TaxID=1720 RepID=UPI0026DA9688|nr:HNH endonuclease signature motif containing protein [Corynebacterium sp.]MDO5031196.1 HNH endonuclease signature motif containing protein [Corynebacterium sp.]